MAFNLLKTYPDLLEIDYMDKNDRNESLKRIFSGDFKKHGNKFRNNNIRPISSKKDKMELLFKHLTTRKIYGRNDRKRAFDYDRSVRLHWVRPHIEENVPDELRIFSVKDKVGSSYSIRTYIYNKREQYVVILEPFRNTDDYYLITAYYLESRNGRKIENKMKRKLPELH